MATAARARFGTRFTEGALCDAKSPVVSWVKQWVNIGVSHYREPGPVD
jgi:hypothetical protein